MLMLKMSAVFVSSSSHLQAAAIQGQDAAMAPNNSLNSSEHGSSSSKSSTRSRSSTDESLLPASASSSGSGSDSDATSDMTSSSPFPNKIAVLIQQLQQGTISQALPLHETLAQKRALIEKALSEELKRAQALKSQLAVLDKMAMAQAAADQQKATLLASAGMIIPPALQQAAAVNALLLSSSLAAQALSPQQARSLADAQALAPLQAANLALASPSVTTLNPLANVLAHPAVVTNMATQKRQSTQAPVGALVRGKPNMVVYRDASLLPDPIIVESKKSSRAESFPAKVHRMLSQLEQQEGGTDIASFLPHGRAFIIHKPKMFTEQIMPNYFRMSHFSSFQRQLNLCKSLFLFVNMGCCWFAL